MRDITKRSSEKHVRRVDSRLLLRRMTITAVCTAVAVVLKCFTNLALNIPGLGIKVGIGGIFNFFPAALCGPLWGGAASALTDLLGHFIAPDGAYIPWLTVTAFFGGCLLGLLWKVLRRGAHRVMRIVLCVAFALLLAFGALSNIALCRDGVMHGMLARQSELPFRSEIDALDLSPLSRLTVGLSSYSKNSLKLTSVPDGCTALPDAAVVNGEERKLTSVAAGALAGAATELFIPSSFTTISDDAASGGGLRVVIGDAGSAAQTFAENAGLEFREATETDLAAAALVADGIDELAPIECDGFALTQSDTYRKKLASNINIVVFGSELSGACGLMLVLISMIVSRFEKKKGGYSGASYLKIAACTVVSGLFVTTINTFILKAFIAAYSDRAIMVLLIPRVAEEVAVRLIQAYAISLLWPIAERYAGRMISGDNNNKKGMVSNDE